MRGALSLIFLVACRFFPGAAPGFGAADAPRDTNDAVLVAPDAASTLDALPTCGGKVWLADFSSDPTLLDLNGDGVPDWAMRDGSLFPVSQLTDGIWSVPAGSQPLDSQPKQTFTTRTLVHGRMRGKTVNSVNGAQFWINVDYDGSGMFAPLFVEAILQADNTQTLTVWTKMPPSTELQLTQVTGLTTDFLDFDLDINPATPSVQFTGGGVSTDLTLMRLASTATDQWATVTASSQAADFDYLRVEVCP